MIWRWISVYYLGVFEDAPTKCPMKSFYKNFFGDASLENPPEWFQDNIIVQTLELFKIKLY